MSGAASGSPLHSQRMVVLFGWGFFCLKCWSHFSRFGKGLELKRSGHGGTLVEGYFWRPRSSAAMGFLPSEGGEVLSRPVRVYFSGTLL